MSKCLTCARWKPYANTMDTNGVRSAGLLPKEAHAEIVEHRVTRILQSWRTGPNGATKEQREHAQKEAERLYTGNCERADFSGDLKNEPQPGDALLKANDGYDSEAWLETHETFGCVQFDQATPEQLGTPK